MRFAYFASILPLMLASCVDTAPTSSGGFRVGMTQEEAFALACTRTTSGTLLPGPTLYHGDQRRAVTRNESICDVRELALAASKWWMIEPGIRERYLVLTFANDEIERIEIKWRGWEP